MWNVKKFEDTNEHVTKFVFDKPDAVAESVLYRYPTYEERTVICCSTMSGCPVGCRFCGAGDAFARVLTADEIVEQVKYSVQQTGVDPQDMQKLQIMFMSMGEPLLNMKHLITAIEDLYFLYPNAQLLVSTSGPDVDYSPFIELSQRIPTVGLQFSVHESTNERRDALIPFKKKLTLEQIAQVGMDWHKATERKPFFNYCAGADNSSEDDAERLCDFFLPKVWNATVSVICERDEGSAAKNEFQQNLATTFAQYLVSEGFDVRVFDPAGQDTIGGGCGQLHYLQRWFKDNPDKIRPSAGNGLPIVHAPTGLVGL